MKVFVLAVLAMAMTSVAKADLYSDRESVYRQRARIAAERTRQEKINERMQIVTDRSAQFERLLRGFIQAHGGLLSDGTCTLRILEPTNYSVPEWNDQQIPLSQASRVAGSIGRCTVDLYDGLACTVTWALDGPDNVINARCYDANSNYKTYRYPGSSAKQPVAKRRRAR